jgi:uncharacterized protein YcaQ
MKISLSTARRLALRSQGLDGGWKLPRGKEGVARAIERLGYVQIDTISVVQRAHEHTLWSRCPGYSPGMLHELQARDRRVFEYWTHAASYVPMCDYRHYLPRMRAFAESPRMRRWLEGNAQIAEHVVSRIREEGPLGSADFESPPGKRGTWWDWKPAKRALEMLFSSGELMVSERRNFQRIYDLKERVLPDSVDTVEPDRAESERFAVRRALALHGVATLREICWGRARANTLSGAVDELVDSGEVTPVEIRDLVGETHYALTEVLRDGARRRRARARLHILSPFDSLVISRARVKALFGFDYSLECYTPAPKRRYGYFCLPILWGERFAGRLDPKADRKHRSFFVRKLMFEPGFEDYDAMIPALAEKLQAFASFCECDRVVVERTAPVKVRAPLRRELSSLQ